MRTVPQGVRWGLIAQALVLAVLAGAGGVSVAGTLAGAAYASVALLLLARALRRSGAATVGPANLVTLVRAVLVGGVAALVVESFAGPVPVGAVSGLAVVALALDAVDGRVARRTGSVSAVGARFDMEVDSALVFLLGVYVADALGPWVLAVGSAHYVLVAARWGLPWLCAPVPPRYWCKVVAVAQALVLAAAATGAVPRPVAVPALLVVAALLAESFGREVWWLWRTHRAPAATDAHLALGPARA